ncbi:MAG TPA: hypothetical protein VF234_07980, partial [Limnochordia bacterium]
HAPVPAWDDRAFASYEWRLRPEVSLHLGGSLLRRRTESIQPQMYLGYTALVEHRFERFTLRWGALQEINPELFAEEPEPVTWETVRRAPEVTIASPPAPEGGLTWRLQAGRYSETPSMAEADRLHAGLQWQAELPLTAHTSIEPAVGAAWDGYSAGEQRFTLENGLTWHYRPAKPWDLSLGVSDKRAIGQSPFAFDAVEPERPLRGALAYQSRNLTWKLSAGYDLLAMSYEPVIAELEYAPADERHLFRLRSAYVIEAQRLDYGAFAWDWRVGEDVRLALGAKYDFANERLERADAVLHWSAGGWELAYGAVFDGEEGAYDWGQLSVTRDLGCRSVGLRYDQRARAIWLEYRIEAFQPERTDSGPTPPSGTRLMFDPVEWRRLFE